MVVMPRLILNVSLLESRDSYEGFYSIADFQVIYEPEATSCCSDVHLGVTGNT